MRLIQTGELPFHSITQNNLSIPRRDDPDSFRAGKFSSPDAFI